MWGSALTGRGVTRACKGTIKASESFLILPHSLTSFEKQKYCQNEATFCGVYSRNNISKLKDGQYVVNLDEYKSIWTHWVALNVNAKNVIYFDSFGIEHIPIFIGKKNITKNVYRIQAYNLIMCEYFCIVFIDFMCQKVKIY